MTSKKIICELGRVRHLLVKQPKRERTQVIESHSAFFLTLILTDSGTSIEEVGFLKGRLLAGDNLGIKNKNAGVRLPFFSALEWVH